MTSNPRGVLIFLAALLVLASEESVLFGASQQKKKNERAVQQAPPDLERGPSVDEPLRLHSDLVVVSVTVTDSAGRYARGLTATDFEVKEDEAPQKVSSFSADEAPFAAAIAIDMSGSMGYKFGLARAAAASFIDHIREGDQVAVYGFNNKVRLIQEFTESRDISDYIWDAKAEETTRLYDCIDEAIDALSTRPERRRAVLIISDGWDSSSRNANFASVMRKALSTGVTVYTLDLIDDSMLAGSSNAMLPLRRGRGEMKELASQSGGRYVHTPQGDKLDAEFTGIVDELRNQYTLTYYSTNQKRDGRWRKLTVVVSQQGTSARSRRGYWAPKS